MTACIRLPFIISVEEKLLKSNLSPSASSLSLKFVDDYYHSPENHINPVPEGLFTFVTRGGTLGSEMGQTPRQWHAQWHPLEWTPYLS